MYKHGIEPVGKCKLIGVGIGCDSGRVINSLAVNLTESFQSEARAISVQHQ